MFAYVVLWEPDGFALIWESIRQWVPQDEHASSSRSTAAAATSTARTDDIAAAAAVVVEGALIPNPLTSQVKGQRKESRRKAGK